MFLKKIRLLNTLDAHIYQLTTVILYDICILMYTISKLRNIMGGDHFLTEVRKRLFDVK